MKQIKTRNVRLSLIKEIQYLLFIIYLEKSIEQSIKKMLISKTKVPHTDAVPKLFTHPFTHTFAHLFKPRHCIIEGKVKL